MTDNNVEHADSVQNAQNVISAEHVGLARSVTSTPDPADGKTARRKLLRDIEFGAIVLIALLYSFYTAFHQDSTANENAAAIHENADRNQCVGHYQDGVDAAGTRILIDIGDILVILSQQPPSPERTTAIQAQIDQIGIDKDDARRAVKAKADYNDADRPLPCPIDQVAVALPTTPTT